MATNTISINDLLGSGGLGNVVTTDSGVFGPKQKTVWYRLRQQSGQSVIDAMGNGPDIPVVATVGTPNLWTTAKTATPPNNGTGVATTYARIIGNVYLESLCSLESLAASQGLLFFSADIYPQIALADATQTIFQFGGGSGAAGNTQAIAFTQHITTGKGRVRVNDNAGDGGPTTVFVETAAALSIAGGAGVTRNVMCGYIDMLNMTVGISVAGGAFVTAALTPFFTPEFVWSDAAMNAAGFQMFAVNPVTVGAVPTVFMGGTVATLGTKCSGLFITRFDTHPGLDIINQLATVFNDTIGVFPDDLRTGKY